jgi:hypothetical protein
MTTWGHPALYQALPNSIKRSTVIRASTLFATLKQPIKKYGDL